jgi:hypothetical protein
MVRRCRRCYFRSANCPVPATAAAASCHSQPPLVLDHVSKQEQKTVPRNGYENPSANLVFRAIAAADRTLLQGEAGPLVCSIDVSGCIGVWDGHTLECLRSVRGAR